MTGRRGCSLVTRPRWLGDDCPSPSIESVPFHYERSPLPLICSYRAPSGHHSLRIRGPPIGDSVSKDRDPEVLPYRKARGPRRTDQDMKLRDRESSLVGGVRGRPAADPERVLCRVPQHPLSIDISRVRPVSVPIPFSEKRRVTLWRRPGSRGPGAAGDRPPLLVDPGTRPRPASIPREGIVRPRRRARGPAPGPRPARPGPWQTRRTSGVLAGR